MSVFEMVAIIVAISVIGGVISKAIKAKCEMSSNNQNTDNKITNKRLADMEQRMVVLEQIVTSEGYDLKQQFKNIDNE